LLLLSSLSLLLVLLLLLLSFLLRSFEEQAPSVCVWPLNRCSL